MKKILIILSVVIVVLAVIGTVLVNTKFAKPATPVQNEQTEKKQKPVIRPKVETETPELLDENDMPKSDVKVPEIG